MSGHNQRRSRAAGAEAVAVRALKDNLSAYLRKVEAGATVVVTSHGRALADLVPHRAGTLPPEATLAVREPTRPWGSVKLARSERGSTDSVGLLLEERRRR